jgi:prepilin-type N-terminal cleavage/methylation domain-containing protein
MNRLKYGFSLLEVVVVILIASVIGISSFNRSDMDLEMARDQFIQHIRYTQSLALFESKYKVAPDSGTNSSEISQNFRRTKEWFKSMWQIHLAYTKGNYYYVIYSDEPTYSSNSKYRFEIASDEIAIDPQTKLYFSGTWKELSGQNNHPDKEEVNSKLNLTLEYGVEKVSFHYLETGKTISKKINIFFDFFGRPYVTKTADSKSLGNFEDSTETHPYNYLLKESIQIKFSKDGDEVCMTVEPISGYTYGSSCQF